MSDRAEQDDVDLLRILKQLKYFWNLAKSLSATLLSMRFHVHALRGRGPSGAGVEHGRRKRPVRREAATPAFVPVVVTQAEQVLNSSAISGGSIDRQRCHAVQAPPWSSTK